MGYGLVGVFPFLQVLWNMKHYSISNAHCRGLGLKVVSLSLSVTSNESGSLLQSSCCGTILSV